MSPSQNSNRPIGDDPRHKEHRPLAYIYSAAGLMGVLVGIQTAFQVRGSRGPLGGLPLTLPGPPETSALWGIIFLSVFLIIIGTCGRAYARSIVRRGEGMSLFPPPLFAKEITGSSPTIDRLGAVVFTGIPFIGLVLALVRFVSADIRDWDTNIELSSEGGMASRLAAYQASCVNAPCFRLGSKPLGHEFVPWLTYGVVAMLVVLASVILLRWALALSHRF